MDSRIRCTTWCSAAAAVLHQLPIHEIMLSQKWARTCTSDQLKNEETSTLWVIMVFSPGAPADASSTMQSRSIAVDSAVYFDNQRIVCNRRFIFVCIQIQPKAFLPKMSNGIGHSTPLYRNAASPVQYSTFLLPPTLVLWARMPQHSSW